MLDSLREVLLTLRYYSKVCRARKLCILKFEISTRSPEISHDFIDRALDFFAVLLADAIPSVQYLGNGSKG